MLRLCFRVLVIMLAVSVLTRALQLPKLSIGSGMRHMSGRMNSCLRNSSPERQAELTAKRISGFSKRRPLLLLDVDGVINMAKSKGENLGWPDVLCSKIRGYNIYWSPTMVKVINEWSNSGLAEIKWLTTWDADAQTRLAPALGFEPFSLGRLVKPFKIERFDDLVSKKDTFIEAARECMEERRCLVWLDDEAEEYFESIQKSISIDEPELLRFLNCSRQVHVMKEHPKGDWGLHHDQADEVTRFLERNGCIYLEDEGYFEDEEASER